MVKKAVLVGCNYPGSDAELKGCVNDVWTMKEILTTHKGFVDEDITVLIDTDDNYTQPTGKNMKDALNALCSGAQAGDILFFHFSGHGTQVPVMFDPEEEDKKNEALCPTDMNLLVDDDLRDIVNQVPGDAEFTVITDCCHSGGMLDHDVVQIEGDKATSAPAEVSHDSENRSLPIGSIASMLSSQLGKPVEPTGVQGALGEKFGSDASKFLYNPAVARIIDGFGAKLGLGAHASDMLKMAMGGGGGGASTGATSSGGGNPLGALGGMLGGGGGGSSSGGGNPLGALGGLLGGGASSGGGNPLSALGGMLGGGSSSGGAAPPPGGLSGIMGALMQDPEHKAQAASQLADDPDMPSRPPRLSDEVGVLITGCQSHETSADVRQGSTAFGALSNAIKTVVAEDPNASYVAIVQNVRAVLHQSGMSQNPCLECSDANKDKPFICAA